jgi:peptide/nickel transport system permease protein
MAEFAYEPEPAGGVVLAPGETAREIAGKSPWRLAGRRLLRNRVALASLALFVLIVLVSFAAPLYATHVAHTDPFANNLNGTTVVDGKRVDVLQQGGGALKLGETPIGPTWHSKYFLGADNQGRDVMARILYGGRASLAIGIGSAVFACLAALLLALVAGFFRGPVDVFLSRLMDLIWAFPIFLLAISLATVLLTAPDGLQWGPIHVDPSSLWVPTFIIALVYVPYVYRPVRGQVLSVREKEYVEAAVAQGASNVRLMFSEILPNVVTTVIVMLPLMIATTILTESALSFLSIGVQPPKASWGTIIDDGQDLLYSRPWVAIGPGIMIVLTVLSLNVLGDGVRDALDPRAKLRLKG